MYTPHWERENNPTASMTTDAMRKYYKSTNVAHTCEFWLADADQMRADIKAAVVNLLEAVAGGKEKPTHRTELERIRRVMTTFYAGIHNAAYWTDLYAVQVAPPEPVKRIPFTPGALTQARGFVVPGPNVASALLRR
jgi:hypothetical protein